MRETSSTSSTICASARGIAIDHLERLRHLFFGDRARLQHPRIAQDGVQRRAQLVRQRREKLVLQAVGALKLLIRLRTSRWRAPRAKLCPARRAGRPPRSAVPTPMWQASWRRACDRAPRRARTGTRSRPSERIFARRSSSPRALADDHLVGELADEGDRPAPHHVLGTGRCFRILGTAARRSSASCAFSGSTCAIASTNERPFLVDHIKGAEVGKVRDGKVCQGPKRLLVVERARQHQRRLGEEHVALAPPSPPAAPHAFDRKYRARSSTRRPTPPLASRMGETVSEIGTMRPSCALRTVSK